MLVRIFLNGTLINDTPTIEELSFIIEREDGFDNSNQILREKVENSGLNFYGDGYNFICNLRKENVCSNIFIRIDFFCNGWQNVFNGIIYMKDIEIPLGQKCIAKVKTIKDNSFTGLLSDFFSTEIALYNTRTKNCEPLDLPITKIKTPTVPTYTLENFIAYDSLDVIRFIVSFFTDNQLDVKSDYLTNNKYAILPGFNFHNINGNLNQKFPTISLSTIFFELRKKTTLFMGIEFKLDGSPYLVLEDENYFYTDDIIMSIDDFSIGAIENIDTSILYNEVLVGSKNTEIQDDSTIIVPQDILLAWNEESYLGCGGCVGLQNSKLDLVNEFIIDSNIINEAMLQIKPANPQDSKYNNDGNIFLINYFVDSGINKLVGDGSNLYNENINNENVLKRWVGISNSCITLSRYNKYGFSLNNGIDVNTGTSFDIDYLLFNDVACTIASKQPYIYTLGFKNVSFDNKNTITTTTDLGDSCSSGGYLKSYFTNQEFGIYRFKAKSDIKAFVDTVNHYTDDFLGGDFSVRFVVYQDNTLTTELDSSPITTVNYGTVYPTVPTVSFDIESPDFLLNVGNVVLIEIKLDGINFAVGIRNYIFHFFNSLFELVKDNTSCEELLDNLDNFKPLITTTDYDLSLSDYIGLTKNKRGVVMLKGKKTWLKRVEYIPDKLSKLTLRHKTSFC